MRKHLEGIRVIDLTAYLSGPFASMNLAAMGAEVIKVERPKIGDPCIWNPPFFGPKGIRFEGKEDEDMSLIYLKRNRGKKSITLDLHADRAKEILAMLVEKADVVIENFAPGAMDRFGFDYARFKRINPRIIYCSISGYGHASPLKLES